MARNTQRQRPSHPPAHRSGGQRPAQGRGGARGGTRGGARGGGSGGRGGGGGGRPGGGRPGGAGRSRLGAGWPPWARVAVPGGIVAVIVVVLIVVATAGGGGGGGSKAGPARQPAPAAVANAVTGVPASVFDQVGVLQGLTPPKAIKNGTPLTSGGKPRVLYLGDEWCPICATERWPMAVALSRFGTFTNLKMTKSSDTDSYPGTNTLSFVGSAYTSPYLVFDPVEHQDRYGNDVMTVSKADQSIEDSLGASGVPFVDYGGKWYLNGASYNPGVLQGLTWQQIASDLSAPGDSQGRAVQEGVIGSANELSAVLCRLTGGQPGAVCNSTAVKAASATLTG